jgi:hypothetical protein
VTPQGTRLELRRNASSQERSKNLISTNNKSWQLTYFKDFIEFFSWTIFQGLFKDFSTFFPFFKEFQVPLNMHFKFKHFSRSLRTCTNPVTIVVHVDQQIAPTQEGGGDSNGFPI